jgi:hypothetical protein
MNDSKTASDEKAGAAALNARKRAILSKARTKADARAMRRAPSCRSSGDLLSKPISDGSKGWSRKVTYRQRN